jgi:hypothetical protein
MIAGRNTYAYISANEVDQLYDSYLRHQQAFASSLSPQHLEINFIQSFIKSL